MFTSFMFYVVARFTHWMLAAAKEWPEMKKTDNALTTEPIGRLSL